MEQENSKLYAIRFCGISRRRDVIPTEGSLRTNESIGNFVIYEVATGWSEAYESAKPKIQRMKELGRDMGLVGLEFMVEEVREVDVSGSGWRIRLERIEQK